MEDLLDIDVQKKQKYFLFVTVDNEQGTWFRFFVILNKKELKEIRT